MFNPIMFNNDTILLKVLSKHNIFTLKQLASKTENNILMFKHLGKKRFFKLKHFLSENNLKFRRSL